MARPVVPASIKEPHHRVTGSSTWTVGAQRQQPWRVGYAFFEVAWFFLARPCYLLWKALLAESCHRRPPSSSVRPLKDVNKPPLFHSWQAPTPPQDWTPNSGGAGSSSGLQAIGQPPASTTTDQSKLASNLSWQKVCLRCQGHMPDSFLTWAREYNKGWKEGRGHGSGRYRYLFTLGMETEVGSEDIRGREMSVSGRQNHRSRAGSR